MKRRIAILALEWPGEGNLGGVARFNSRLATELAASDNEVTVYTTNNPQEIVNVNMRGIGRFDSRISRYYIAPIILGLILLVESKKYHQIFSSGDDWGLISTRKVTRIFHGTARGELTDARTIRKINHWFLHKLERISSTRISHKFAVGPDSSLEFNAPIFLPIVGISSRNLSKTKNPSIIFIGNFNGRKRGYLADQIVALLKKKYSSLFFTVITSNADRDLFKNADSTFVDLSEEEKQNLISKSWIIFSLSSYEGFGIPIFEAMLEGTIPIATENAGSAYQLKEIPCLLVGDSSIFKVTSEIIESVELRTDLSQKCKLISHLHMLEGDPMKLIND